MNAKKAAYGGVMAAAALCVLLLASVLPSGKIGLTATAGVMIAFSLVSGGRIFALLSYAAVSSLALLLLPSKNIAIAFAAFFGIYPIIKNLLESAGMKRFFETLLKLAVFNALFSLLLFAFKFILPVPEAVQGIYYIIFPAANLIFVLYDIAFSLIIGYFINKLGRYLKK